MTSVRPVSKSSDPVRYHYCSTQFVKRAFLCAEHAVPTGALREQRAFMVDSLTRLSTLFAISVYAYAMRSDHYRLVVSFDAGAADLWSDFDVLDRWCCLFPSPLLLQRYRNGEPLLDAEQLMVADRINLYRCRLTDLSWFLRCLNETILRTTGNPYWTTRIESETLPDNSAMLGCMLAVDLDQYCAGSAKTEQQSCYTSIQQRMIEASASRMNENSNTELPNLLLSHSSTDDHLNLACANSDYLDLIDCQWKAQRIRKQRLNSYPQPAVSPKIPLDRTVLMHYLEKYLTHIRCTRRRSVMQTLLHGFRRYFRNLLPEGWLLTHNR